MISKNQLEKIEGYTRSGIQAGAEAAAGGKVCEREGYFFESTIQLLWERTTSEKLQ